MKSVHAIYYSPTETSQKIALEVACNLAGNSKPVKEHDLTLPLLEGTEATLAGDDLAVIAVPVYAGRVAPLAVQRLRSLRGENTPAVVIVLYGNREYEDALLELYDIAARQKFVVVAAGAFIGEHSFSSADTPIAQGRPDVDDLQKAREFSRRIQIRLVDNPAAYCDRSTLPGNEPYKDGMGDIPLTPQVNCTLCTLCGECVKVCPSGAIEIDEQVQMDVESCTFCCACIKNCPEEAVTLGNASPIVDKKQWLHENCAIRKEPELFLKTPPLFQATPH